jgi:Double zinc ribbon
MAIEALAAVLVGMALVWLVVQPLVLPNLAGPEVPDLPDPEETPRGRALLALKEIEFDRATGKLSDADYESLHARYAARAIAALDAPVPAAESDRIEALVAQRVAVMAVAGSAAALPAAAAGAGAYCLVHGNPAEPGARFCSVCGAGLVSAEGACLACGAVPPADALFCPGCGTPLRT